jgi:hypothetical protein
MAVPSESLKSSSSLRDAMISPSSQGAPATPVEGETAKKTAKKGTPSAAARSPASCSKRLAAVLQATATRVAARRAGIRVALPKVNGSLRALSADGDMAKPYIAPYVPPGARLRRKEQEQWEMEKAERRRRLAEEDAATGSTSGQRPAPNIRALARKWEPKLEQRGTCCFNLLQKDDGVEVDDYFLHAQCVVDPLLARSRPGVKGLPVVAGGRYQYEVELLSDSAIIVGWSAATSLPSSFDGHSFGYASKGVLVGHGMSPEAYGFPFGRSGDVIGAFIEWPSCESIGPRISFALNGRWLGEAFDMSLPSRAGTMNFPPMQPHVCQALGPPFEVRLRGANAALPLRFREPGFEPLGNHSKAHFCPFSEAVAQAGDVLAECRSGMGKTPTVARRLIHGSLGLQLPLSHLAQEIHAERRSRRSASEYTVSDEECD